MSSTPIVLQLLGLSTGDPNVPLTFHQSSGFSLLIDDRWPFVGLGKKFLYFSLLRSRRKPLSQM